jgi:hypothetical protein
MFIDYGLDESGELVYIEQVQRGKTSLRCPYCNGPLTARKGEIKAAHFAHTGETCAAANRDQAAIALPAYDNFNLHLPGKILKNLQEYPDGDYNPDLLERHELVKYNEWKGRGGDWELTHKGKLVLGQLSLMLFNQFQEPLISNRYQELQDRAKVAWEHRDGIAAMRDEIERLKPEHLRLHNALHSYPELGPYKADPEKWRKYRELSGEFERIDYRLRYLRSMIDIDHETALVDIRLYRAQWRRILKSTLYFLKINDGYLYKIGVTTRPIEERIKEIAGDLMLHLSTVSVEILGTWPGRGNVELYFKHRYKESNNPLGSLTEYYKFDDAKPILLDLRRMKKKELSELELTVLANEPSEVEHAVYAERVEALRRANIRRGMVRAARRGKSIGRPAGGEDVAAFLAKPQSQAIVAALASGVGIREAARNLNVSINTVRKVRDVLESSSRLES